MDSTHFPLMCYWNGEICEANGSVSYKGGDMAFVFGDSSMNLDKLVEEIYEGIGVDKTKFELKVKMKYPSNSCYKVVNLNNERALEAMWASIRHSNAGSMDLYINVQPLQSQNETIIQPPRSSYQPTYVSNQSPNVSYQSRRSSYQPPYASNQPSNVSYQHPNMSQTQRGEGSRLTGCGDVSTLVCLSTNNLDELGVDGNIEGDEVEDGVEDRLLNDDDDEYDDEYEDDYANVVVEDDDNGVDVIAPRAPHPEFNRLYPIDEAHNNSWLPNNNYCITAYELGGEFQIGQRFANKNDILQSVTEYHLKKNQTFRTFESRPTTVVYKCGREPSCSWALRATKERNANEKWKIVTYKGAHQTSCVGDVVPITHRNMKRKFVCEAIRDLVKVDWGLKIVVIMEDMKKLYNYEISYLKAWRAKQKALGEIFGDWDESYQRVHRYLKAVQEANPGSIYQIDNYMSSDPNVCIFKRAFWSFAPCIEGFRHCRPIITIDGTFLYGKYNHVLLIAMGTDAQNQLFPLAFALVDKETHDSWSWFMSMIREYVTDRQGLCVISDRHAGIMNTMNEEGSGWEPPFADHRYCIRHHASNLKTRYCTELKELFCKTAFQHSEKKFNSGFDLIAELFPVCRTELEQIPLSNWSLCYGGKERYGIKTSNLAESFNNVLKGCRFLPIAALVECTFYRVNAYFVERREWARSRLTQGLPWSVALTMNLDLNIKKAGYHKVEAFDHEGGLYEVRTRRGGRNVKGNNRHKVNLGLRTCTCNKWQIYHYPCSHAIAICRKYKLSIDQYVDSYYSCLEHFQSYEPMFFPIADEAYWEEYNGPKVTPDVTLLRKTGRPKSKRIRNEMDESSHQQRIRCSLCGVRGHNKRGCPTKESNSGQSSG